MANLGTELARATIPDEKITNNSSAADQSYQNNILITAKGGSISFAGRLFEYIVRFLFSILVARVIGAEQYGLYALGLTIVPILAMFALMGLQTGVVAYLAPAIREKDESRIWGIVQVCVGIPALISILLGVTLFLFAEPIAILGFHDPQLIPLLKIVSISIPLDAIGFIAYQIIISYKRPKYSVLANNIVVPLAKLLITIGFLALGMGVLGVILAHVIATALGLALLLYFVNFLLPVNRPIIAANRNTYELLRYSIPVHLGWVLNTVRGTLEILVLGFFGLTTGVGIFAVAQRLGSLGTLFFLSIGNISTPIIAEFYKRGELDQLKNLYQTTTKWVLMFNLPVFLTFVFFSKQLLSIFGDDFSFGSAALIVLAVGNLFYTGTGIGANILDMTNHTKYNIVNSVFMIIVTILSNLLLIPRWGVIGAAVASSFSTVIVNVVCMIEVLVLFKMQPYRIEVLKPILAGFITAVITYIFNQYLVLPSLLHLIIGASILWGVYILIMTLLRFDEEDIAIFINLRSSLKSILFFRRSVPE